MLPGGDLAAQANDLQAAVALAAGYFGGYSAKMQDIGQKEIQKLSATLERKVASDGARSEPDGGAGVPALLRASCS